MNIIIRNKKPLELNDTALEYLTKIEKQLEASEKARKEAIDYIKELYDNTDDTTCYDIDKGE